MIKQYEKSFNEKIDSFKDHENYESLRKKADISLSNHTGYGPEAIIAADFMDRIIIMPKEYILDWLDGKNNLQWREQDKLMLNARRGGYAELQAFYPEVEIKKIGKGSLKFYQSLGFMLLKEENDSFLVTKTDEINAFKKKQYDNLSDNGKKLYQIFKKEFIDNGELYNGCISRDSTIATTPCFSAIEELIQANIIQLRNFDGFVYELTETERNIILNTKDKDKELYVRTISADICDLLEEVLDKYNLTVPSEDREGEEGEARIYGGVYSDLEDDVTNVLATLCETVKENPGISINADEIDELAPVSEKKGLQARNFSVVICGLFEDLLDEHDITIPSDDREGEEDEGRIFGEIYYSLEDQVTNILIDLCEKVKAAPDVVINIEDYNGFVDENNNREQTKENTIDSVIQNAQKQCENREEQKVSLSNKEQYDKHENEKE